MLILHCTIEGIAPYSQSQMLTEKKGKNEGYDEFETRIWRSKAHVGPDGDAIVIPGHAVQQMLVLGAQKGRLQPKAARSAREGLANRLVTGIAIQGDATTDMRLSDAICVAINAHSTGKRGSGTRVVRKFPQWPNPWTAEFDIIVLDESLTEEDVTAALQVAGLVAGLGRFRPENMGMNGRFRVLNVQASEFGLNQLAA